MRRIKAKHIVGLVLIVAAIWWFKNSSFHPFKNLFTSQPVVIDETPIIIKDIKSIAQLVTITVYDEVVVDSNIVTKAAQVINAMNSVSIFPVLPAPKKNIVLVCKGKILAGIDLQKIDEKNMMVRNDTAFLQLPSAVILDAIINPGDFETFDESGKWTEEEVIAVKLSARQKLINRAIEKNVLRKANSKATAVMEEFLRGAGFKNVLVSIR